MKNQRRSARCRDIGPLLRAIADPSRRRILDLLAREDLPVRRIVDRFRLSRPAVMKHLRVLRSAELISSRRCGRERIQSLNAGPLREVEVWISRFEVYWENALERLKRQVEADQ